MMKDEKEKDKPTKEEKNKAKSITPLIYTATKIIIFVLDRMIA